VCHLTIASYVVAAECQNMRLGGDCGNALLVVGSRQRQQQRGATKATMDDDDSLCFDGRLTDCYVHEVGNVPAQTL
jgi:hypothetical protein